MRAITEMREWLENQYKFADILSRHPATLEPLAVLADRKGWCISQIVNCPCDGDTKVWEIWLRSMTGTASYPGHIGTAKNKTISAKENTYAACEQLARIWLQGQEDKK